MKLIELPLHKKYYADFIRMELNTHQDSLIQINRSSQIGRFALSLVKTHSGDKRREAIAYVQGVLPKRNDIRFTKRLNYLNYEGEIALNDYIKSLYDLRIISLVIEAKMKGITKKDAIYNFLLADGICLDAMNFDQISKAVYRFEIRSRNALNELLVSESRRNFDVR